MRDKIRKNAMYDDTKYYATLKNDPVIILGYQKSTNQAMVAVINQFASDEKELLERYAKSVDTIQNHDYILSAIKNHNHPKSGVDLETLNII